MRTSSFVLIACLAIAGQARGTQVYETPSGPSQQLKQEPWRNPDSAAATDAERDKYRPVAFGADDAQPAQDSQKQASFYNANVHSGDSGVAGVLAQQSVRNPRMYARDFEFTRRVVGCPENFETSTKLKSATQRYN